MVWVSPQLNILDRTVPNQTKIQHPRQAAVPAFTMHFWLASGIRIGIQMNWNDHILPQCIELMTEIRMRFLGKNKDWISKNQNISIFL